MRDLTDRRSIRLASSMPDLVEALRDASGPDRDVDAALEFLFLCVPNVGQETLLGHPVPHTFSPYLRTADLCPTDGTGARPYTASVDEALRLVEAVEPNCEWPEVLLEAQSDLRERFRWHVAFPRPGQLEALAPAILRRMLVRLGDRNEDETETKTRDARA